MENGAKIKKGILFGLGSPLLDISVTADDSFLKKYELEPNDCILAKDRHKTMYSDLVTNFDVDYVPGGSTVNSIRVAQWLIGKPLATVFFGCIGKDKFGQILEEKAKEVGVDVRFQYHSTQSTGTTAVIVTKNGLCRSMCAYLAASGCYTIDHLNKVENYACIQNAEYYYIAGYFLTVCMDSILMVADHALKNKKTFSLNLSSHYISVAFKKQLMTVMPYVDILFGNESEAAVFAQQQNFGVTDLKEIARMISNLPKKDAKRSRTVIVTQGPLPIIVANDNLVLEYQVTNLQPEDIVDTNGAGDAFVGGFLSQLVQNHSLDICVKCGIYAATEIIQRTGCDFPATPSFKKTSFFNV